MNVACVPLPAPGAPNRISLIGRSSAVACERVGWCRNENSTRLCAHRALRIRRRSHSARTRSRSSGVSTPGPGASPLTCTAMRSPCHSTRSCSSDFDPLERRRRQRREAAQERRRGRHTGRRGAAARLGGSAAARRLPSRQCGIGAREKYSARPAASSTTLTTFGLANRLASSIACAAVAITQSARASAAPRRRRSAPGRSAARRLAR